MEMVEKQRQTWEEQQQHRQQRQQYDGQDDVESSHHHSSKDTTASSCDPASLSVATASSRQVIVLCIVQGCHKGRG